MNTILKLLFLSVLLTFSYNEAYSQETIEEYQPVKEGNFRTGIGEEDFLPFIQSGYTLMLPKQKTINGVLIFLEDSGFDKKNKSAKQLYRQASEKGFAVLSVSSEIPFDFYFSEASMLATHALIEDTFIKYKLPNDNIFFLGASLVGHRAMRYIKFMKEHNFAFQPNINGLVICNFTMDFTRKWYQHKRDIKIKRIDLWEPTFINYLLETYLKGTPKTNPENYYNFSSYSYFAAENKNITFYKDYGVRAYIEPAIKYKLTKQLKTLYENNATDMVGFLAELELAGNKNTELIVIQPDDNPSQIKNTQSTWDSIDKEELMEWIQNQIKK